jgi:hypothetical protein
MPTKDEKAEAERQEKILKEGRFNQAEAEGDNSLLTNDDAFVGVDAMYQNAANETDAPAAFPDPEKVDDDDAFHKREAEAAKRVNEGIAQVTMDSESIGHRGYVSDVPHPSAATTPASGTIEANRVLQQAAVQEAEKKVKAQEEEVPRTVDGANSPQTDQAKAAAEESEEQRKARVQEAQQASKP